MVALFADGLDDGVSIPGTESQEALDTLAATFPQVSGASAQTIVVAPEGQTAHEAAIVDPITDAVTKLDEMEAVAQAASPFDEMLGDGAISDHERAAIITVQMADGMTDVTLEIKDDLTNLAVDLSGALPARMQSAIGGVSSDA